MSSLVSTVYGHLDYGDIRLFRIREQGSSNQAKVLETVQVDLAPRYYALSYCWGSQPDTVPIEINGTVKTINYDLAMGVRRLRQLATSGSGLDTSVHYVWIDKICINQANIAEREMQVQLMRKIYSNSVRTLIWLGPSIDSICSPWSLVDHIYDIFQAEYPAASYLPDIPFSLYSEDNHKSIGLPPWDDKRWTGFRLLLQLPWFERIWVVQEVALSPKDPLIIHGDNVYPWERIGWAASWLRRRGYIREVHIPDRIRNIDSIANIRRSSAPWPLDALLIDTSTKFHATDQRDKIYGLLGLAAESHDANGLPEPLKPDYSATVEEVYTRVGLFLLQQSRSLTVLTRTSGGPGTILRSQYKYDLTKLPSWTPDWGDFSVSLSECTPSLSWITYSDVGGPATLKISQCCDTATTTAPRVPQRVNAIATSGSEDQSSLRLSGLSVDRVVRIVPIWDTGDSRQVFKNNFDRTMRKVWNVVIAHTTTRGLMDCVEKFVEVTTMGKQHLSGRDPCVALQDGSAFLLKLLYSDHVPLHSVSTETAYGKCRSVLEKLSVGGNANTYSALAQNYCFKRSLILTSRHFIGVGPTDTQLGDLVVLFYGGDIPYIIREKGEVWRFIGESYFVDAMGRVILRWSDLCKSCSEAFEFI